MTEVTQTDMVTIEVDGQSLQAKKGSMLIEATDAAGITVPRFCYHPKLSVAANCRMCLVEVERAPKPLPACATPIMDGMKVMTKSAKAIDAQRGTMEFLLINHPLDCPVCDQGGECELQDLSVAHGGSSSRYAEEKRAVTEKNIGPLVATEMTRCIHCTRCVRFGDEVAGLREMGAVNRGEHVEIGTYVEKSLTSELSGNIIDICPVGALTAKPSRFAGRSWEFIQHAAVSPHDGVGSNLYLHTLRGKIVRAVSREADAINETWISDRDRFSYEAISSANRVLVPSAADDQDLEWNDALEIVRKQLQECIDKDGADAVGIVLSPNTSQEEAFLLKRIADHLGIEAIDYRLRQQDFRSANSQQEYLPWLGQSIAELEDNAAMLMISSNIRYDQPLLGHRVRKAALKGAKVFSLSTQNYEFTFPYESTIAAGKQLLSQLAAIAVAAAKQSSTSVSIPELIIELAKETVDQAKVDAVVAALNTEGNTSVLLGAEAISDVDFSIIEQCAKIIAVATDSALAHLATGSNNTGLAMLEVAGSQNISDMVTKPKKAYVLWGVNPALDCIAGAEFTAALQQADIVIAATAFNSDVLKSVASVILPITAFGEFAGTSVNLAGMAQSTRGAQLPSGKSRSGWRVARVLANLFSVPSCDFSDIAELQQEIDSVIAEKSPSSPTVDSNQYSVNAGDSLVIAGGVGIYQIDDLVRNAEALQQTALANVRTVRISPSTAAECGVAQGDIVTLRSDGGEVALMVEIDGSVAEKALVIMQGTPEAAMLGLSKAVAVVKGGSL
jgi:NADH-quinone oxidoreductase subunit G